MIALAYLPPLFRHRVLPFRALNAYDLSLPIFTARDAAEPHEEQVVA